MLNHIITNTATRARKLNNKILQIDRHVKDVSFSAFNSPFSSHTSITNELRIFTHSLDIFYFWEMTRELNFSFKN